MAALACSSSAVSLPPACPRSLNSISVQGRDLQQNATAGQWRGFNAKSSHRRSSPSARRQLTPPYAVLSPPPPASSSTAATVRHDGKSKQSGNHEDSRTSDVSAVSTAASSQELLRQQVAEQIAAMGLQDTELKSTNVHRAWVGSACAALLLLLGRGVVAAAADPTGLLGVAGGVLVGYILADLGTGFYHFGVDNYGDATTPIFGPQIDAFQGHHRRPWTITKREFANNLQALAKPILATALPALLLLQPSPSLDAFLASFLACVMFSQQSHAWSHSPKTHLPPLVVALQDAHVLVPRRMHGAHHRSPFNCNYCIVSGLCNWPLDALGVFPALERVIFQVWGVPPRSWSAEVPEWVDGNGDSAYYEDGGQVVE